MTHDGWDELLNEKEGEKNIFDGWFIALSTSPLDGGVFPEGKRAGAVFSDESYYNFLRKKESYN